MTIIAQYRPEGRRQLKPALQAPPPALPCPSHGLTSAPRDAHCACLLLVTSLWLSLSAVGPGILDLAAPWPNGSTLGEPGQGRQSPCSSPLPRCHPSGRRMLRSHGCSPSPFLSPTEQQFPIRGAQAACQCSVFTDLL